MALVKDTGFLLRKVAFSESSFIIKAFTREHGLISFIAKGAKRPKSRWRGLLEPVLHLQLLFPEFSRSELRYLGEVSLLRDFSSLREHPVKQALAHVFSELLLKYSPSESDAAQFHDLFLAAEEELENAPSERAVLQMRLSVFLLGYCSLSGFQPQFRVCVRCGDSVSGANIPFQMDLGGPVCSRCQRLETATHSLREGIVHWLDALQTGGESAPLPTLGRSDAGRTEEFLLHYLGTHAGGEKNLKAVTVWHELMEGLP